MPRTTKLKLSKRLNDRVRRVQIIHTRNGYAPAFDVSGVKGVGVENGFQWINLGWNSTGIYDAGKLMRDFPVGKLGKACWLITGKPGEAGKNPFGKDGNAVAGL